MAVQRFCTRPVEVEAVQWTGNNAEEIHQFVGFRYDDEAMGSRFVMVDEVIGVWVYPDVGDDSPSDNFAHLNVGDWVIKDEHGITARAADAFPAVYDPVPEDETPDLETVP